MLYVVSGHMRTGTSMMMLCLEAGGLDAEYDESRNQLINVKHADESYTPNEKGLYELNRAEYQEPNFPRKYDGKLIKALNWGPVRMAPMEGGIRVVFMRRDAEEARQSYNSMLDLERPRKTMGPFQQQMDHIIENIRNRKDVVSCHEFWYREVVEDPMKHFETLCDSGWPIDADKATSMVNPKLCRFKTEKLDHGVI